MIKNTILTALALVALPMLALSRPVMAAKAEVVDNAGFFSADAVSQANQKLADIDQKYGKQMRVETFPTIPDDLRRDYTEANKRAFFEKWARQRAQAAGIRGVFVLICKDPASLHVIVGDETRRSGAFTQADRMTQVLAGAFRQKDYDKGLNDAIELFRSALQRKADQGNVNSSAGAAAAPSAAPPSSPSNSSTSTPRPYNLPSSPASRSPGLGFGRILFFGVIIVIALGLLRRIFRSRSSGPTYGGGGAAGYGPGYGNAPGGYGGYGGGGGFGRGFGGGILGGLLGGWLGNQMSRHGDSGQAYGSSTPPDTGGGTFHEPPSIGGGESFSGGDSSSSSGADFGGGGGDSFSGGGGDSGGSSGSDF